MQVGRGDRGRVRGEISALARLGFFVAGGVVAGLSALVAFPAWAQNSMSSGGSPSHAVNIAVHSGMEPNLGRANTGLGANGTVFGWTPSGLSLVSPCTGEALSDGHAMEVTYTAQDRLCRDGQHLFQTDASGNAAEITAATNCASLDANGSEMAGRYTEHRAYKDIDARIRAYVMANVALPTKDTALLQGVGRKLAGSANTRTPPT